MTSIYIKEKASQGTPTAAYAQIWTKNTTPASVYIEDDVGNPAAVTMGNITGTLVTAAQPNVTSVGTLTTLTVDDLTLNGAVISSGTGAISFADENLTTTGTLNCGALTSTGIDDNATSEKLQLDDTRLTSGLPLFILEQAADAADVAGYGQLWVKNTTPNELWFTNDAGAAMKVGSAEGTAILSTGEAGGTKFLREDGDGTCSWQAVPAVGSVEGTAILSTGEVGGTKYLREDGDGTCSWQAAPTPADNSITMAKLADIATSSFVGRVTAGTGDPEVLTATQATALLNTFTTGGVKGLAPGSTGGTTDFLRADGQWATPPGGGGNAFTTFTVTDTDSGSWSATGSVVADTGSDTITWVSGVGIDIDADPAADAIRVTAKAAQTGITSMYNTSLQVGYSSSNYMDFNSTSFDVVLGSSIEFRFENDGDFHADGNISAYSTTISSDRKLKMDFERIEDAVHKVLFLEGQTYTMKKTGERKAGLIAQDVLQVLPEAVREIAELDGMDSHLQLDYNAIIGLLVNAVKELTGRVRALENKA